MLTAEVGAYLRGERHETCGFSHRPGVSNSTCPSQIILKFQSGPHAVQAVKRLSTVIKIESTVKNT
jgi:hypothetical protein